MALKDAYNFMLQMAIECNNDIALKLAKMLEFNDELKWNRWFGYCQRAGEDDGMWSLEQIIELVKK